MHREAFLGGYEHDIFVSYAHEDQLGAWTVALREDLRKALNLILLSKLEGRSVDVWIDQILRNNLPLTDQLQGQVEGSALLVIVMSPFYLGSTWCGREVAWFWAAARSRIAPDRRIFVVHALPTNRASWPTALTELTPYPFFARHLKADVELPLGLIGDDEDKTAYKAVLYNLAGQSGSRSKSCWPRRRRPRLRHLCRHRRCGRYHGSSICCRPRRGSSALRSRAPLRMPSR
jgi:hypothetical protein